MAKNEPPRSFVKVLQMHGIEQLSHLSFAMMPVSDLFPQPNQFLDCAHETNAGLMCDGYIRTTARWRWPSHKRTGVTGVRDPGQDRLL